MSELNYRYELDGCLVIIEDLQGDYSVYARLDEVLAQIEAELGSLAHKYILCEGRDGYWDLVVPDGKEKPSEVMIYALSALSLPEAKEKLHKLVASGQHLREIS